MVINPTKVHVFDILQTSVLFLMNSRNHFTGTNTERIKMDVLQDRHLYRKDFGQKNLNFSLSM